MLQLNSYFSSTARDLLGATKASAGLATIKLRGRVHAHAAFTLALAAYSLIPA